MLYQHSLLRLLAAIVITFSFQTNSLATPVNINFGESTISDGLYPEINFTSGGVELNVTSSTHDGSDSQVLLNEFGLGVKLSSGSDGSEIDNLGPDESLILTFSENITLLSATFSQLGLNDDVIINSITDTFAANFTAGTSSDTGEQTLALTGLTGNEFTFSSQGTYSEYSLKAISFSSHPVSAPTTFLLLLSGLLIVYQRKRQKV